MSITPIESKELRVLKKNMLDLLYETLKIKKLNELDRQILYDIIRELASDERSQYHTRLKAFVKREYIITAIEQKYVKTTFPNCSNMPPANPTLPLRQNTNSSNGEYIGARYDPITFEDEIPH